MPRLCRFLRGATSAGRRFLSLVQNPVEAVHDSMPESAIEQDHVDGILTLAELAEALPRLVVGGSRPSHARRADVVR